MNVAEDCGCSFRKKDPELGKTNLKLTCAESEAGKRRRNSSKTGSMRSNTHIAQYTTVCQMHEHNLEPYFNSNLYSRPWRPFSGSAEHYTPGARLRTACFDGCAREVVTLNNAHSRWNWLGCTANCWSRTGRSGTITRHSAGPIQLHHTSMPWVQDFLCMCLPALWPLQENHETLKHEACGRHLALQKV